MDPVGEKWGVQFLVALCKNFKRNPLAQSLYPDLIQEAVTRLFELSGKTKEMANGKYSERYAGFWIAHNAMLAFLKTWEHQNKWCTSFEDEADPILRYSGYSRQTLLTIIFGTGIDLCLYFRILQNIAIWDSSSQHFSRGTLSS
jgi:hypothetical protein